MQGPSACILSWAPHRKAPYALQLQVLLAEAIFFGKRASRKVVAAIVVVCAGVGLSTVTDTQMGSNVVGWAVGGGAVLSLAERRGAVAEVLAALGLQEA